MTKGRIQKRKRTKMPSPVMESRFSGELSRLLADFKRTAGFQHAQTKGNAREGPVRELLIEYLPDRFDAVGGEIVDVKGGSSPQIDVIVYNSAKNAVLLHGDSSIVPAEAALITIEVKSTLTASELINSLEAAAKLKSLKPLGQPIDPGKRIGESSNRSFRYMHCIFAYNTDLVAGEDWAKREHDRFIGVEQALGHDPGAVDRIYVADRGLIMPLEGKGLTESALEGRALMVLFLHIMNFCMREDDRRPRVDYENYVGTSIQSWRSLVDE